MNSLGEAARDALKTMATQKYEFQSDFARHYIALGRKESQAPGRRFLRAAERHVRGRRAMLVHPRRADFELRGDHGGAFGVAAPYRAAQAVARVVGAAERIVDVAELQHWHDRPELFLAHEAARLIEAR